MRRAWGALFVTVATVALTECVGQDNGPGPEEADAGPLDGAVVPPADTGSDTATGSIDATVDARPGSGDAAPDVTDSAVHVDSGFDATPSPDSSVDSGVDSSVDTGVDSSVDTGVDSSVDAAVDAGIDAAIADAAPDAPPDAALDAATANYALRFDDTVQPQYVFVPGTALLDIVSSFTMEAWVNLTSAGHTGAASVVGQPYGPGGIDSTELWFQSGDLLGAVNLGGSAGAASYAWPYADGTWHHVAWTYDASSQQETLYVDGAPVAQVTSTAGLPLYDGHPLLIGADIDNGSYTYGFDGVIDDVRLFAAVRTAGQIGNDMALVSPVGDPTLVAYYTFDEGAGTLAHDSSGNHFDGTLGAPADAGASVPAWVPSTLPQVSPPADAGPAQGVSAGLVAALEFDPSYQTECVSVPDDAALDVATTVTYEAWIEPIAIGSGIYSVVGKPYGTGNTDSVAIWFQGGTLYAAVNGASTAGALAYAWSLPSAVWHHVAFTYASAGAGTLYLDGVSVAQATSSAGAILYDANPFLIGADIDGQAYQFTFPGLIREVRLFSAVRTPSQIALDMGGASPVGDATLIAYYPLAEGSGTTAHDLSANALDGTFGATGGAAGAPTWVSAKGPF